MLLVSAWVFSRYSGFLPQYKDMHVGLNGKTKLSVGLSASVNGCAQTKQGEKMVSLSLTLRVWATCLAGYVIISSRQLSLPLVVY